MKGVVLKFEELSDSREVMESRTPKAITVLLLLITIVTGAFIAWSVFFRIDDYYTAAGEIRTAGSGSRIMPLSGGTVSSLKAEGDHVEAGDTILRLDTSQLSEERDRLNGLIREADENKSFCERLKDDVQNGSNSFSPEGGEEKYYYEYEKYASQLDLALLQAGDSEESKAKIRKQAQTDMLISVNSDIEAYSKQKEELASELEDISRSIDDSEVVAAVSGRVSYSSELAEGDIIPASTQLGSVIPENAEMKIVLYISDRYISDTKIGQKVEYTVNSLSGSDSGKIYGRILSVSDDPVTGADGAVYYTAEADIDGNCLGKLTDNGGKLLNGMTLSAHVVSGSERLITRFWNMIKT